MVCVRQAWLALGSNTIQLDNPAGGWYCSSLDLGTPVPRAVVQNRPGADGALDRTAFMGPRTVTATITVVNPPARLDDVADNFAPYMVPSARPTLHYVLDRGSNPERYLTVRGDSYDWPVVGAVTRDVALQFIAADPIVRDVNTRTVTTTISAGGFSSVFASPGDVAARPLIRLSAVSANLSQINSTIGFGTRLFLSASGATLASLFFVPGYVLGAGNHIDVDTAAHTASYNGDPTQSVLNQIDWTQTPTVWPVLPAGPNVYYSVRGTDATNSATVAYIWNDGYLT
jgi:hypothetical protein